MLDISEIALELWKNGRRWSMASEINGRLETFQYIHTFPTDLLLLYLNMGLFVTRDAKLLRKLCGLNDNARGCKSRWSFKVK